MFLLVFLGLWNQVLNFIECIPTDPVQEGKAIPHADTNLPQAEALGARAPNSKAALASPRAMGRNLSLNQVDDTVGHAARLGVKQDVLLAMQLTDH